MRTKLALASVGVLLLVGLVVFAGVRAFKAPPQGQVQLDDPEQELLAALGKGRELEQQGKPAEAIGYFEKAVVLTPKVYGAAGLETFHARIGLALRYQVLGRYAEAGSLYQRSLSVSGNIDEALTYKDLRWRFLRQRLSDWARHPPEGADKAKLPGELQGMRQEADQLERELNRIRAFDRLLGLEKAEEDIGNRALGP